MNSQLLIKITSVILIAAMFFVVLWGTIKNPFTANNDSLVVKNNDLSEVEKFKQDTLSATKKMEEIIQTGEGISVPAEFKDLEKNMLHVENLIAEVENETGEKFVSIFDKEITLDPVKDKEFYQLDKKFEELDDDIIDVIDQL